ncbi:SymE family type I addiction module toxin [Providencia vermicola]|nr:MULTISPECIES: SymE family type I addiction module toxin [Providencia]WER23560.1 SymE family type I addiction module toxin [Providencia stuartii]WER27681.1 SymE family type I addiction module toxin [Providencia stuartii]WER31771.1 SymE family type I addiction module toxin [Providencia stuartii]
MVRFVGILTLLSAISLKSHWLKTAGFEIGFTFTVNILNCCLVLNTGQ